MSAYSISIRERLTKELESSIRRKRCITSVKISFHYLCVIWYQVNFSLGVYAAVSNECMYFLQTDQTLPYSWL